MRNTKLLKIIANTSVAVGLGAFTLFGGVARGETFQQRVQAEMNSGKDYSAAWAEASRELGPLYSSESTPQNYARNGMYRGLDYYAAWQDAYRPPTDFSPQEVAGALKARQELNQGKDYSAAWEDAGKEEQQLAQPVRAASKGGGAGGYERSTK